MGRGRILGPFGSTIEARIVRPKNKRADFLKEFGGAARI